MAISKNAVAPEVVVLGEAELEGVTGGAGELAVTPVQQLLTSFSQNSPFGTVNVTRLERKSFLFDVVAN